MDSIKAGIAAPPPPALTTVLPVLVDPAQLVRPGDFSESSVESYRLFTLGGKHVQTAVQEPLQEGGQLCDLRSVVNIYVGLSKVPGQRLGNRHNHQTEALSLSFMDKVRHARRLLLEMSGEPGDEPLVALPQQYKQQFKKEVVLDSLVSISQLCNSGMQ